MLLPQIAQDFYHSENRAKIQSTKSFMKEDLLTRTIIGLAMDVHTALGPGEYHKNYSVFSV
ncbi:hypothetical protein DBR40_15555 [Pedobacter sp. KBW01]|uniref:hypothetical protein n=1 Tax=Pedobacter sp. KBW01 TaxID=2153364 RepID=UPI000F5915D1|nr:hypothetical protein [Pedobacter sp. KBW01]RQO72716.1 hypothetical protein DBR40_15555 [Pedobacter sp. KBW01]